MWPAKTHSSPTNSELCMVGDAGISVKEEREVESKLIKRQKKKRKGKIGKRSEGTGNLS